MAIALTLAYTTTPLDTGDKLLIFASPQLSAGVTVLPKTKLRYIFTTAAAAASPANILAAYTALFGALVAGNRIFFRLIPVASTGIAQDPFDTSILVT